MCGGRGEDVLKVLVWKHVVLWLNSGGDEEPRSVCHFLWVRTVRLWAVHFSFLCLGQQRDEERVQMTKTKRKN